MQLSLTKKEQLQKSTWSGGTTTQLAIFPKEAVYQNLDFIFRISTATIDVAESKFTGLPDVSRIIMILDGELTIQHKDQYVKHLKKFDTDAFSGNWETTGVGKVTDFNVMTRGSATAAVAGFTLQEKNSKEVLIKSDLLAIYIFSGNLIWEEKNLSAGDIVLITKGKVAEKIVLEAVKTTDIVMTELWL